MKHFHPSSIALHQRGVSLLFAMLALVLLAFGAMALLRTVDTGTLIMGNLSLKQGALNASASGTEQALAWLTANAASTVVNSDSVANGYYAAALDRIDVSGNKTNSSSKRPVINWTGDCQGLASSSYETCEITPATGTDVGDFSVGWVITRLCDTTGIPTGANRCLRPYVAAGSGEARERGQLQPGGRITSTMTSPYYRIIVRAQGPRNTVVYTETMVHF